MLGNQSQVKTIANSSAIFYPVTTTSSTTYYFMRGQDVDCLPTITYRYWAVTGTPATNDSAYSGTRCGATPFTNISVSGKLIV